MSKTYWSDLAAQGPVIALAPMDGYCDTAYRQVVKSIAPQTVVFAEFYSADGLVRSRDLASKVLPHHPSEKPVVFQIFGKDPAMFAEAAKIIEGYGAAGVDINMGCPAKKVVKSGHGSSLMIHRDTAFRIVEEMSKAVKIPVSVKTRLGWESWGTHLIDFCKGLESAGANLISVHGRTYQQAFTGKADFTGIYELRQHLNIPVFANGDVMSAQDGSRKVLHPVHRKENYFEADETTRRMKSEIWNRESISNLDGFMIGRASFGNPWCFLPSSYQPTLSEILAAMELHARLLIESKGRKGAMEIRKHLVQYLHGFEGVKTYRSALVRVESLEEVGAILQTIASDHSDLMNKQIDSRNTESQNVVWDCGVD